MILLIKRVIEAGKRQSQAVKKVRDDAIEVKKKRIEQDIENPMFL